MIIFIVKDVRNYLLCNVMCSMYPDEISGVTYDEAVVTNYYANYDTRVYINTKRNMNYVGGHMSFVDDWSLVEDIEGCVVISKSDMYSKFTHLCEYIGLHYEEPKRAFSHMTVPEVREDDTAIIEFLEYHDVKYDIVDDAHPIDIPTLLYDMSYYTARS